LKSFLILGFVLFVARTKRNSKQYNARGVVWAQKVLNQLE